MSDSDDTTDRPKLLDAKGRTNDYPNGLTSFNRLIASSQAGNETGNEKQAEERYPRRVSFYGDETERNQPFVEPGDVIEDDFEQNGRTQSITPEEWEEIKKATRQESIRPTSIEEPETPLSSSETSFKFESSFDPEYSKHFGKPFGKIEPEIESEVNFKPEIGRNPFENVTSEFDEALQRFEERFEDSVEDVAEAISDVTSSITESFSEITSDILRHSKNKDSEENSDDSDDSSDHVVHRRAVLNVSNDIKIDVDADNEYDSSDNSDSSVDSTRYTGTEYNPVFKRQYSNPQECFTPPPESVPEFPGLPTELIEAFAQGDGEDEPYEDPIEKQVQAVMAMLPSRRATLASNPENYLDWVNRFTNKDVENFDQDFQDPNVWISLIYGLMSQLGQEERPSIVPGDLYSAYGYCDSSINYIGLDERIELGLLTNAEDFFGGHGFLNQTLVSLLYAAHKTKLVNYQAQQPTSSHSESESNTSRRSSVTENARYDDPASESEPYDNELPSSQNSESEEIEAQMERPRTPSPCPVQDEPSSCPCENTSPDKDVKTNTSEPGCPFAKYSEVRYWTNWTKIATLAASLFFCLQK